MPQCCGKTGQIVFEETWRRGEEQLSVDWRVGDFFSLSGYWGDYYDSPYFCFNKACWYFRLFTNVHTRHPASDKSMTLYFNRADSGPPRTVQFTLGIKGAEGVEKMRSGEYPRYSSFPEIWSRLELRNNKSRLMPEDVLTINCDLKIMSKEHGAVGGVSHQDVSIQTCDEFREPNACIDETQPLDRQGIEKVAEDVGKLLVSGAIKDITVQVGDVEFQVNRNVLLARSPVLSAPSRHEGLEEASGRISACKPDVFREFLRYIHSESIQFLTEQKVFDLYRIAYKYSADDLKLRCLAHMRDTLSVQTFCDTVQLALSHGQSDLLKLALDFGNKNIQSIVCSAHWQDFNREHPTEANEILIKCICRQI